MRRLLSLCAEVSTEEGFTMPVPVWLFLIIVAIIGVGTLILEPRRRKAAAERKALFEQRKHEGEDGGK